jgi:hypothetical protein
LGIVVIQVFGRNHVQCGVNCLPAQAEWFMTMLAADLHLLLSLLTFKPERFLTDGSKIWCANMMRSSRFSVTGDTLPVPPYHHIWPERNERKSLEPPYNSALQFLTTP